MSETKAIRNLAVIAHVDHGKTTLLDAMLQQSGVFEAHQTVDERVMDSMDQERERGITILSKTTALEYKGTRINVVDTPGHADFGGEVERVLRMVDATLLLVDANEGPMPQTRFVLGKALELGLPSIVVINKIDRDGARPDWALNEVFDLFCALGASDEQLDFGTVYASAKSGYAMHEIGDESDDLDPLFETIMERVPKPQADPDGPLQAQIAILDYDSYLGPIGIGRIYRGTIKRGDRVVATRPGGKERPFRISNLMGFLGLKRVEQEEAFAGDIIALAGGPDITVGDTICAHNHIDPMDAIEVDPPTITMHFRSNDSPFAGQEGQFVTSRHLRNRLMRERDHNVSLVIEETENPEIYEVSGRGVLHLGVFIETLRREGYELQVGPPEVIFKDTEEGTKQEPYEKVTIQVPEEYCGTVIENLSQRGGRMEDMGVMDDGTNKLEFTVPSRGMIGFRTIVLTLSRGTAVVASLFSHYGPYLGPFQRRKNGALVIQESCETVAYALNNLQGRGSLFLSPGIKVYAGQLLGLNAKENDLIVNPGKKKQLTNMRSSGSDDSVRLTPPLDLSLEQCLELITPNELVEVTPKSLRIRKKFLDHNLRKREEKNA
jgi:GTP-binding protein